MQSFRYVLGCLTGRLREQKRTFALVILFTLVAACAFLFATVNLHYSMVYHRKRAVAYFPGPVPASQAVQAAKPLCESGDLTGFALLADVQPQDRVYLAGVYGAFDVNVANRGLGDFYRSEEAVFWPMYMAVPKKNLYAMDDMQVEVNGKALRFGGICISTPFYIGRDELQANNFYGSDLSFTVNGETPAINTGLSTGAYNPYREENMQYHACVAASALWMAKEEIPVTMLTVYLSKPDDARTLEALRLALPEGSVMKNGWKSTGIGGSSLDFWELLDILMLAFALTGLSAIFYGMLGSMRGDIAKLVKTGMALGVALSAECVLVLSICALSFLAGTGLSWAAVRLIGAPQVLEAISFGYWAVLAAIFIGIQTVLTAPYAAATLRSIRKGRS